MGIMVKMVERTPYEQLRQIGFVINRIAIAADIDAQSSAARKSMDTLKRSVRRAQDVLKEYEMLAMEEDTLKQAQVLPKAVKALQIVRESILKASEYELIGAVDVGQICAEVDELIDKLH